MQRGLRCDPCGGLRGGGSRSPQRPAPRLPAAAHCITWPGRQPASRQPGSRRRELPARIRHRCLRPARREGAGRTQRGEGGRAQLTRDPLVWSPWSITHCSPRCSPGPRGTGDPPKGRGGVSGGAQGPPSPWPPSPPSPASLRQRLPSQEVSHMVGAKRRSPRAPHLLKSTQPTRKEPSGGSDAPGPFSCWWVKPGGQHRRKTRSNKNGENNRFGVFFSNQRIIKTKPFGATPSEEATLRKPMPCLHQGKQTNTH